jgi:mono/diheme cytochrome c family protein
MTRNFAFGLVILFLTTATISRAADQGATLYKSKCSGCHGLKGEGKPAVKAPAIKGTAMDAGQIADHITKGDPGQKAPHSKGMSGITGDQAKAIAAYVKTLK